MSPKELRKAERARLQSKITGHLDDFSNQYEALEFAIGAFGADFNLARFKQAFNSNGKDREAYRDVQAVERAAGRIQGYIGDLARDGALLVDLPREPEGGGGSRARQAFEALRQAEIIDGELCGRLVQAQKGRSMIEHEYIRLPAGKVHETVSIIRGAALEFIGPYRAWIEPYLD
jgi:hypothetical protein